MYLKVWQNILMYGKLRYLITLLKEKIHRLFTNRDITLFQESSEQQ